MEGDSAEESGVAFAAELIKMPLAIPLATKEAEDIDPMLRWSAILLFISGSRDKARESFGIRCIATSNILQNGFIVNLDPIVGIVVLNQFI